MAAKNYLADNKKLSEAGRDAHIEIVRCIKQGMKHRNLSTDELAKDSGVDKKALEGMFKDDSYSLTTRQVGRIAAAMDIEINVWMSPTEKQ